MQPRAYPCIEGRLVLVQAVIYQDKFTKNIPIYALGIRRSVCCVLFRNAQQMVIFAILLHPHNARPFSLAPSTSAPAATTQPVLPFIARDHQICAT